MNYGLWTMNYLEAVLKLQSCRVRAESQVIIVAVQLVGVTVATCELIHRREFQVALIDVIVHDCCRQVEETVLS